MWKHLSVVVPNTAWYVSKQPCERFASVAPARAAPIRHADKETRDSPKKKNNNKTLQQVELGNFRREQRRDRVECCFVNPTVTLQTINNAEDNYVAAEEAALAEHI